MPNISHGGMEAFKQSRLFPLAINNIAIFFLALITEAGRW